VGGRNYMGDLGIDGWIILKYVFKKWDYENVTGLIWLSVRPGSYDYGNKPLRLAGHVTRMGVMKDAYKFSIRESGPKIAYGGLRCRQRDGIKMGCEGEKVDSYGSEYGPLARELF
jgi:hypothetical protein